MVSEFQLKSWKLYAKYVQMLKLCLKLRSRQLAWRSDVSLVCRHGNHTSFAPFLKALLSTPTMKLKTSDTEKKKKTATEKKKNLTEWDSLRKHLNIHFIFQCQIVSVPVQFFQIYMFHCNVSFFSSGVINLFSLPKFSVTVLARTTKKNPKNKPTWSGSAQY